MAEAEVGDDGYGEDPTVTGSRRRSPSGWARRRRSSCRRAPWPTRSPCGSWPRRAPRWWPAGAARGGLRARGGGPQRRRPVPPVDDADGTSARPTWPGPGGRRLPPARAGRWSAWRTPTWPRAAPWSSTRWGRCGGGRRRAVHMDGARLFNAEVATGVPAAAGGERDHRDVVPLQGPVRPGRLAAGRPGRRHGRGPGRAQAAGRGHAPGRGRWPPPAWWPCARWSSGWPRTTPGPGGWPRRWPSGGPGPARPGRGAAPTSWCSARPSAEPAGATWRPHGVLADMIAPGPGPPGHPPRRGRRRDRAGLPGGRRCAVTGAGARTVGPVPTDGSGRPTSTGWRRSSRSGSEWAPAGSASTAVHGRRWPGGLVDPGSRLTVAAPRC